MELMSSGLRLSRESTGIVLMQWRQVEKKKMPGASFRSSEPMSLLRKMLMELRRLPGALLQGVKTIPASSKSSATEWIFDEKMAESAMRSEMC